jgi:hypothetical protein
MKRLSVIMLLCALLAVPFAVHADVAPPYNPPGTNLQPGAETTQVRMVAETVLIEVKDSGSLGTAAVTADFTMRNLGSQEERMAALFPMSSNDGRDQYPSLTGIKVKVNGKQVPTRTVSYPDLRYPSISENVPWAEFDVSFPVGQDVEIEVRYGLQGSGYPPYTAFYYVLSTGAGWKDTIGKADIILRLPYAASPQNVVLDQIGWATTTPGGVFQGNEMHWHFEDFEPGTEGQVGEMEFGLVAPWAWQAVLKERQAVSAAPNDGEAWGRLGKAYKAIFFMNKGYRTDAGGTELYNLSIEAYERCLELLPKDAQWHAGFADLLTEHGYWQYGHPEDAPELYRGLKEIQTALQLAPRDAKVLEIAEEIHYMFPDGMPTSASGYDFAWLTSTPTPRPDVWITPSPEPTEPMPTVSSAPVPPSAPAPARASNPLFHACGSAVIVPAAICLWVLKKRRS